MAMRDVAHVEPWKHRVFVDQLPGLAPIKP
jgi:hypothetical protein